MNRGIRVMEEDWDNLIILDACRYDNFSETYGKYLPGKLSKVKSLGSHTFEWCMKNFQGRYDDVVYVSASVFVNSREKVWGFNARDHFYKIIDVLNSSWDEELGTVHPKEVNKAVMISKDQYPDKRFIIHYMQPNAPYIGCDPPSRGYSHPVVSGGQISVGLQGSGQIDGMKRTSVLRRRLASALDLVGKGVRTIERKGIHVGNLDWKLRETLDLPPVSPLDAARREIGVSGLRKAYLENLKLVLKYASELSQNLSGTSVITSSHGELLGERGSFEHPFGFSDPLLLDVPWFIIDNGTVTSR